MTYDADLVFRSGKLYTVDGNRSWAEAVAISGGEITFVGSDAGAEPYIGPATRVVDLNGRMMLPSFQDSHIHTIYGGINAIRLDMLNLKSPDDYVAATENYAGLHPDAPWIIGAGWDISNFEPGAPPTREYLDDAVSDRAVVLMSYDGHAYWVNSKALELAGITKDTPDPAGGRIDRDPETGEPNGILQDRAMYIVDAYMPEVSSELSIAGLKHAMSMLNSFGITAIQDATEQGVIPRDLDTFRTLDDKGELTMRVVASLWWNSDGGDDQIVQFKLLREKYTQGRLRATSVKIMQDGVIEAQTAALLEPYLGSENIVAPMNDPDVLRKVVSRIDAEGFQVHFHAIGDAAVRQCLDAVEQAIADNGQLGNRHHISHVELIHPSDIPRFRELDVTANFQPLWAYSAEFITELTWPFIGPERSQWIFPIGSVERAGGRLAFGSDWPVSTANPLEEIETAITRLGALGETTEPLLPNEAIDLASAIAAFTINAAFINNIDDITGSIEVGKLADLIILDQNLFEIESSEISEAQVLVTFLDGEAVYGDLSDL